MNSMKRDLTYLGFIYEQQEEDFDQSVVRLWTARRGLWPIRVRLWKVRTGLRPIAGSFMNSKKRALTNPEFVYEQQEEGFDQSRVRLWIARRGLFFLLFINELRIGQSQPHDYLQMISSYNKTYEAQMFAFSNRLVDWGGGMCFYQKKYCVLRVTRLRSSELHGYSLKRQILHLKYLGVGLPSSIYV